MGNESADATSDGFEAERAGILLDRLAEELLRIPATDPAAGAELQHDVRELLRFLRAALSDQRSDLTFAVPRINRDLPPAALASILRELAGRLLDMADQEKD